MTQQAAARSSRRRGSPSQPLLLLLFLLLLGLAATARAALRMSVLSAGTPQAALEVEFEGVAGPEEETLHADARSIVSRSGALSLSVEAEPATGAAAAAGGGATGAGTGGGLFGGRRDGQGNVGAAAADRRVTLAHLAARPGKQGGSALLAPEQPGDVAVVELLGVGPQQQQGEGGGAVVVVRGAASVLARTSGVVPGPVKEEDRALLRAFAGSSSSSSSSSAVGTATAAAGAAAAPLVRYHGRGRLALTAFGSIHRVTLREGETRVVKGGHLLAWTEPARVRPESSSSTSSITVTGPGTAFLRSHIPSAYRRWAVPALPQLQAAVADAAAKATSAAAATAGGKRRPEDGGEQAAELPVMLRREGLGKRLRRRVWRLVAACLSALLLVAGVQVAQTLLMHGPEGLKDVPQNLLLLLEGLRRALLKAWVALVKLYRSDLWSRLKTVLSPSSQAPTTMETTGGDGKGGGGGFFMGSSSGGCAVRRPEAEEGVGPAPPLFAGSDEGWEEE